MSLKSSTNVEVNTHELILEVDAASFDAAIEKVYQKEKKNIAIPGFRKGKVSRKMAENYFGENAFYEEAINSLVGSELYSAIEETKLEVVAQPSIELVSVDKENGVVLKATCITKPEVSIENYKGVAAPKVVKEITDAEVDEQIETLRKRNARIVPIEDRPAEMNDEVVIDFEGFKDDVAFEGGKGEDFPLTLGSKQFIPGFEEQIVGHSVGEDFEINVTFPESYGMEDLAGKEAVFKIKIKEIKAQELPELDDEFVKDTSEFDTLEELKNDIKTKMIESSENQSNIEFENAVFDKVINSLEGVIPQCMFDSRIDRLIHEFENKLSQSKMSLDLYLQYTGMDMDEFRATYKERAEGEVKLRLALEKIAQLENIEVTDEEVENGIKELADNNKMEVEQVKKIINIEDYKLDLLAGKAAEIIKESAVVDNTLVEEVVEAVAEEVQE